MLEVQASARCAVDSCATFSRAPLMRATALLSTFFGVLLCALPARADVLKDRGLVAPGYVAGIRVACYAARRTGPESQNRVHARTA
jgi:hypothetical protein